MSCIRPDRLALLVVLALLVGAATPALGAEKISWDAKFYDPHKASGDLVLPMPCGGAMVFRRIDTPTANTPLDDVSVVLGNANADTDYSEFVRPEAVVGPFLDGSAARRYMLFGKYEVTRDQYAAMAGDACPTPSFPGRVAASNISWIDAVEFSDRYSAWLYKQAKASLPGRGQAHAFVRLPTEVEWEFAARGGAAVQESEFRARLFPMKDDVAKYVWFEGARSANGQLRPVGLLLPNPVGLYDIVGNVSEIVLDSYRLNKVGRPHGLVGGFIAKGGDYQTPEDSLRTAMRIEYPPFDEATAEPTRLPTVGFRVILALPAVTDVSQTVALQKSFKDLSEGDAAESENPDKLLQTLIAKTENPLQQEELEKVADALRSETRARAEQEAAAAKNFIRLGAVLIRSIRDYSRRLDFVRATIDDTKKSLAKTPSLSAGNLDETLKVLSDLQAALDYTATLYADNLIESSKYGAKIVEDQAAIVISEYKQRGESTKMPDWVSLFMSQQAKFRKTSIVDQQGWLAQILVLK